MAKEITMNQLKGLKGKTMFIINNGKIVACRFKELEAYTTTTKLFDLHNADKFRYVLECADGTKISEYHAWLPKIYYTIDDCVKGVNSLQGAYFDIFAPVENIMSGVRSNGIGTVALTWWRNPKTLTIEERSISNVRYDVIKDKLWSGCGPEYKEFVGYKTKEECQKNCTIEIITFF